MPFIVIAASECARRERYCIPLRKRGKTRRTWCEYGVQRETRWAARICAAADGGQDFWRSRCALCDGGRGGTLDRCVERTRGPEGASQGWIGVAYVKRCLVHGEPAAQQTLKSRSKRRCYTREVVSSDEYELMECGMTERHQTDRTEDTDLKNGLGSL